MNRNRLKKLIVLVATLSDDDRLRRNVMDMITKADAETKAFAQATFDQQKKLKALLHSSANATAKLESRLLNIPNAGKDIRRENIFNKYYLWVGAAALFIFVAVLFEVWLKHSQWAQRLRVARQLAALVHTPMKTLPASQPPNAGSAASRLPFNAIVPIYTGFKLIGYSTAKVSGQAGFITWWKSQMGRPCMLVQLPPEFAARLQIRRPLTFHVRDSAGIVTATVTIWRDTIAHCSWAQVLPGDVNFYRPLLLMHGRPI